MVITTLENNLVPAVKLNKHIHHCPTTPNIFSRETLSLEPKNTVIINDNILCLLCVGHCSKCSIFLNYITLHHNHVRQVLLLLPFYKSEKIETQRSYTTSVVHYLGNGTPLQYSCLENPMYRGAWWAAVHGVATSRTRLNNFTFTLHFHALEKEMATHSRILAWRIPGTGEPGGLLSMGSHRDGHD